MVTLNPGDRVGPFTLVEKLGEGGFAEVWKAERADEPGRIEALKIPTDPDYAKQLRTEDRLRKGLEHPNIVRLLGEDLAADPPYLRMQFVPGQSLEALLQRTGALPVQDALDIAEQVAKALDYAHGRGVIHADVKPSNVLIDPEGVARLTDFGLGQVPRDVARSVLKSQAELSNARSRAIVGTFDYMAPEQRAGEPIDGRADLYALGRMLYRMLTGSLPTGLRLPSEVNPSVPSHLDALVARLLENRADRTPSAAKFLEELLAARRRLNSTADLHPPATSRTLLAWAFVVGMASIVLLYRAGSQAASIGVTIGLVMGALVWIAVRK